MIRRWALALILLGTLAKPAARGADLKTFDGKYSTDRIAVRMVYFLPSDRTALPDWRDRLDYFRRRIEDFHTREFQGQSKLEVTIHPEPFRSRSATAGLRAGDADAIFFATLGEVDTALKFGQGEGKDRPFPILLVLSDINWRPLDDFYRLKPGPNGPEFEGNYTAGRHHPGAESGGARAIYLDNRGVGWGLVSADGWRVPYQGSDCVIYHEGVGHTIGLPHTEPADDSVMSMAQYHGWISESWVDRKQKEQLGWKAPAQPTTGFAVEDHTDLFRRFVAIPRPSIPKPGGESALALTWPDGAKVRQLRVRFQTDVFGPWVDVASPITDPAKPPTRVVFPAFDRPTPVSYRVDAELEDGTHTQLWGYFQVRDRRDQPPMPSVPTLDLLGLASPIGVDAEPAPSGEDIELLSRIDVKLDAVSGEWTREGGVLTSPKQYGARIEVPYSPPDEYRLTAIVEPRDEPNSLTLGVRSGGHRFLVLAGFALPDGEPVSALENVDGQNFDGNPTSVRRSYFRKGRPSEVVATVRKDGVDVTIDGRPAIRWRGESDRLSLGDYWKTPHDEALFVGAYDCRFRFLRLTLTPLAGTGKSLRELGKE